MSVTSADLERMRTRLQEFRPERLRYLTCAELFDLLYPIFCRVPENAPDVEILRQQWNLTGWDFETMGIVRESYLDFNLHKHVVNGLVGWAQRMILVSTAENHENKKRIREEMGEAEMPNDKRSRAESHRPKRLPTAREGSLYSLHKLLWGRNKELRAKIFETRKIVVPMFDADDSTTKTVEVDFTFMSLATVLKEAGPKLKVDARGRVIYAGNNAPRLPCLSVEMVYRSAYTELYQELRRVEEARGFVKPQGHVGPLREPRGQSERSVIVTGPPGCGKTYFGSLVSVERLLEGLPTVVQTGSTYTAGQVEHFLLDDKGVRPLDAIPNDDPIREDCTVWILVDRKPRGILADLTNPMYQTWHVVTTSPLEPSNFKDLKKQMPGLAYLMPNWNWAEIVAGSGLSDFDKLKKMYYWYVEVGPDARLLLDNLHSNIPQDELARNEQEALAYV